MISVRIKRCVPNHARDQKSEIDPVRATATVKWSEFGADEETRTPDPRITNALLYHLSYIGTVKSDLDV